MALKKAVCIKYKVTNVASSVDLVDSVYSTCCKHDMVRCTCCQFLVKLGNVLK